MRGVYLGIRGFLYPALKPLSMEYTQYEENRQRSYRSNRQKDRKLETRKLWGEHHHQHPGKHCSIFLFGGLLYNLLSAK
jgi:hypothetical protein